MKTSLYFYCVLTLSQPIMYNVHVCRLFYSPTVYLLETPRLVSDDRQSQTSKTIVTFKYLTFFGNERVNDGIHIYFWKSYCTDSLNQVPVVASHLYHSVRSAPATLCGIMIVLNDDEIQNPQFAKASGAQLPKLFHQCCPSWPRHYLEPS